MGLMSQDSTPIRLLEAGIGLFILYILAGGIYRLYFSPLARFPGPKLAALTLWYEFYFDVILRGQFTFKIQELHKKYGPIIRINPWELHFDDPDFYDEVYSRSRRTEKFPWSAAMFGNESSILSTVTHEQHRARRSLLNPFFSKQSINNLEPLIRQAISTLCSRFEDYKGSKEPVALNAAISALTSDIISEYTFGNSMDMMLKPGFAREWEEMTLKSSEFSLLHKQFPFFLPLLRRAPNWLIGKINPGMEALIDFQQGLRERVLPIVEGRQTENQTSTKQPTIFHALMDSSLPESEKTLQRLMDEVQTIIAAGALTTAHFLAVTSYHILANPPILTRLRQELESVMPNPAKIPPLRQLEQLPFLKAVINEGFRLSYGVTGRLTRVYPDAPLLYKDQVIPAGTPVSMTSVLIHQNETLFPDPMEFRPDRWLEPGASQRLEKYLVNFSKGSRSCVGINLAKTEIPLALAAVFGRRFEMELFETDRGDVDLKHDFFNPCAKLDSKGVRVIIN